MKAAELNVLLGRPVKAIEWFQEVADLPLSILSDQAQFRAGEVYERVMKNKEKAIETFQRLLEQFPHSLYVDRARTRIRTLRGDIL